MSAARTDISVFDQGRFDLPRPMSRLLLGRQLRWAAGQVLAQAALHFAGLDPILAVGLATGLGLCLGSGGPSHLLPVYLIGPAVGAMLLSAVGMPAPVAAAAAAGFLISGSFLVRMEGALAGGTAVALVGWTLDQVGASGVAGAGIGAVLLALAAAQSLLPAHVRFTPVVRVPTPLQISRNLEPGYRSPCMRAWQIDGDLARSLTEGGPDSHTREGLAEVGSWVYRLALTLQTLDHDILRINPDETAQRRELLLAEAATTADTFIRDRHQGTAEHLSRLLEHRDSLVRERARVASLQDYALAYLEEARAGLAVARVLPGERSPEQLGMVLDKLRSHAAAGDARRRAVHEMERVG